jgi:hypothetical protein
MKYQEILSRFYRLWFDGIENAHDRLEHSIVDKVDDVLRSTFYLRRISDTGLGMSGVIVKIFAITDICDMLTSDDESTSVEQ